MKEPTRQFLRDQLEAMDNAQPMTVYCALCPEWRAEGTSAEARAAAEAHRAEEHPEIINRKIVRKRRSFSQSMTEERQAEIEEERRKRMRALGIA